MPASKHREQCSGVFKINTPRRRITRCASSFRAYPPRQRLLENSEDATGLSRGDSRLLLHKAELLGPKTPLLGPKMPRACVAATVNLHGASPWHLWANNSGCVAATVNLQRDKPVASPRSFHAVSDEVGMRENLTRTPAQSVV